MCCLLKAVRKQRLSREIKKIKIKSRYAGRHSCRVLKKEFDKMGKVICLMHSKYMLTL